MPLNFEKIGSIPPLFYDRAILWTSNMVYEDSYIPIFDADWVEGTDTPVVKDCSATGWGFRSAVVYGWRHPTATLNYITHQSRDTRYTIRTDYRSVSHPGKAPTPKILESWPTQKKPYEKTPYPSTVHDAGDEKNAKNPDEAKNTVRWPLNYIFGFFLFQSIHPLHIHQLKS